MKKFFISILILFAFCCPVLASEWINKWIEFCPGTYIKIDKISDIQDGKVYFWEFIDNPNKDQGHISTYGVIDCNKTKKAILHVYIFDNDGLLITSSSSSIKEIENPKLEEIKDKEFLLEKNSICAVAYQ